MVQLFRGIRALYSLGGAAQKKGRYVQSVDLGRINDAAVIEQGGKIVWVGEEKKIPRAKLGKLVKAFGGGLSEVNLNGAAVIPGLVESHTHLLYAGNRAAEFERRSQGESYQAIAKSGGGILSTVRATRLMSQKDLVRSAQTRIDRYLRQGVTTVEVKSGYALNLEGELKMLRAAGRLKKARVVRTFLGAHALPPEFASAEEYVDHLVNDVLPKVKQEGLATRVDVFLEAGYFDQRTARRYLRAARKMGFDLVIHADQLTRSGGAQVACKLGARSAEHLLCVNKSDIQRLAASEVTCVLLPIADLYLSCPYPPARKLLDAGARIALATDFNPGSSPSQDVALVGVLARTQMKMSFAEVLAAYTVGGAFALGLEHELGSISAGKLCDFCVLEDALEELFLEVGRMPIARLYSAGKRVI